VKAVVRIRLRPEVLDAPGRAVAEALRADGFPEVRDVRIGKVVEVELATDDVEGARDRLTQMGERLLAHPVIETFDVELTDVDAR
jgi:phosphoribosylformylglycinamidine synthase